MLFRSYYSIGTSLERVWGAFRYNVYLLLGMIFTVIGSLLIFALGEMGLLGLQSLMTSPEAKTTFYILVGRMFSTYYINMSIFLAYASTFPDMQVLFMMIIPIKVKWLGIGYMALLIYDFLLGSIINKFIIGASVLNFIVFYLTSRNAIRMSPKQIKRRHEFKKEVHKATGVTKHKCAICGRTEETNPDLEFRFCSKCDGNYEYCQEHLFTHEHVKK